MEAKLRELIPFLRDRNPQVRHLALSNLISQTPKDSPHRNIFFSGYQTAGGLKKQEESDVIRDLKLLCRDQLSVAHDAFRALVNLSDSPLLVVPLSDPSFLTFLVSYVINPEAILADLASMLLSNLTASSTACSAIITLQISVVLDDSLLNGYHATQSRCGTCIAPLPYPSGDPRDVLALPFLVDAFVQGAQAGSAGNLKLSRKGELHFLASVFANLSAVPAGRDFFLSPQPVDILRPESNVEYPLAKIMSFTEHNDTIRRGGVVSTIKNCTFHTPAHRALLSPDSIKVSVPPSELEGPGIGVLPYILLPLAGPEELDLEDQERLPSALQFLPPTKKREPDSALRFIHIETLLMLCTTRWGRDVQRLNGVYEIVRAAHESEKVDKISEHIERLVNLLKREEPSSVEVVHDLESVSEDEDSRIEEL